MTDKPEKAEQIGPTFAFRCPICHYRIWCGRPCTFDPDRPIASPPHELSNLVFATPPLIEARRAEREKTHRTHLTPYESDKKNKVADPEAYRAVKRAGMAKVRAKKKAAKVKQNG